MYTLKFCTPFQSIFFLLLISCALLAQPDTKVVPGGLILPRLTTLQRNALPAGQGQTIYNTDQKSIQYQDATGDWHNLTNASIADLDGDTYVTTELLPDEDVVHLVVSGSDALTLSKNSQGLLAYKTSAQNGNILLGAGVGGALSSGATDNIAIGDESSRDISTGLENISLGTEALASNTTGEKNIVIGHHSMTDYNSTFYNENIVIGHHLVENTGDGLLKNVIIGHNVATNLSTSPFGLADRNVIIGEGSLKNAVNARQNVAIGGSMQDVNGTLFGGSGPLGNIGIGAYALNAGKGQYNIAIGGNALQLNESGNGNVAIGSEALQVNLVGVQNTAIGSGALNQGSGSYNVAIGFSTGLSYSGNNSVLIGREAGSSAVGDNVLHIANNASRSLISGKFDLDEVTIDNVVKLIPRTTPPSNPVSGTIYMDDGSNTGGIPTLRVYINGSVGWKNL